MTTTTLPHHEFRAHRTLNVLLWIGQLTLAFAFVLAGATKATTPWDDLASTMSWVRDAPMWLPRVIGAAELVGVAGLIVPALTRVHPILTACASASLAVVVALAVAMHLYRGEISHVALPAVLCIVAVLVAWGRFSAAGRIQDSNDLHASGA
ncbi:MAG TPA: DoxX family protein [Myxococcota bacterium]|jgi:uncharacterized membrane protein YphA (DoxX/SURF4 family)